MGGIPLELSVGAIVALLVLKEVFGFLKGVLGKDDTSKMERVYTKMFVILEAMAAKMERNEKDHSRIIEAMDRAHSRCEDHRLRIENKMDTRCLNIGSGK